MGSTIPLVLLNASVVLAGIKSPSGGSGKVLSWSRKGKINCLASEIIFDEIVRNGPRIGFKPKQIIQEIEKINIKINPAPKSSTFDSFKDLVKDFGDTHVLASAKESKADFLVTLDKKHLLILKKDIKEFKIVSPGDLIEILRV